MIDTGFTGSLTVTAALAGKLGLDFRRAIRATLADGSRITFPSYRMAALWTVSRDTSRQTPRGRHRSWLCDCSTATACTLKSRMVGASSSSPRPEAEPHCDGGTAYRQVGLGDRA